MVIGVCWAIGAAVSLVQYPLIAHSVDVGSFLFANMVMVVTGVASLAFPAVVTVWARRGSGTGK